MSDKEELEKIAEKYKKRNQYINQWQKDRYYRLTVLIPKEQKDTITETAKTKGFKTVSDYIKAPKTARGYNNGIYYKLFVNCVLIFSLKFA